MKQEEGKAIILHVTPFQDYDAVIDLLTEEHGRISVMAKGIRKSHSKNKGHVRIGSLIWYEIFRPKMEGMGKLKKLDTLHSLLSEDLREQTRLILLCEIIRFCIPPEHSVAFLFPLWESLFGEDGCTENMWYWLFIKVLQYEGFLPFFSFIPRQKYCLLHENGELLSVAPSGELCKKVHLETLKVIKFFQQVNAENTKIIHCLQLSKSDRFELWEVLWWVYSCHSDFFPRSKKVYESIDN